MKQKLTVLSLILTPLWAQNALSLHDAVQTALAKNQSLAAAAAGVKGAQARVNQASSGYLPRLNYMESFARSDNPVFVFSTLLTEHRFGAENFAIGPLNRPDAANNFQSQVTVDQVVYDAGHETSLKEHRNCKLSHSHLTSSGVNPPDGCRSLLRRRNGPRGVAPSNGGPALDATECPVEL